MTTKTDKILPLKEKVDILNGLAGKADFLMRGGRYFTKKQKEHVDALEYGLKTRLEGLQERYKHEEADMKIAAFKELIDYITPKEA